MSRSRIFLNYGLWAFGVIALFSLFIGFKRDAALVASLSAAGTVAAAGFAAFAAMGSMRAAAESAAAARRSREAIARTARPRVFADVAQADGAAVGGSSAAPGGPRST